MFQLRWGCVRVEVFNALGCESDLQYMKRQLNITIYGKYLTSFGCR